MTRKRFVSTGQAKIYYEFLKKKIEQRGCTVEEVKELPDNDYAAYYPETYCIEVEINRSLYVMLVMLAHEFGHFIEYVTYFKHYGKRAYNKYMSKNRFGRVELVMGEASAWVVAEKELNKIDSKICVDYRFRKYRAICMEQSIEDIYKRNK